jgi:hypothetical protein
MTDSLSSNLGLFGGSGFPPAMIEAESLFRKKPFLPIKWRCAPSLA